MHLYTVSSQYELSSQLGNLSHLQKYLSCTPPTMLPVCRKCSIHVSYGSPQPGVILYPRGHLAISRDILVVATGAGSHYWHLVGSWGFHKTPCNAQISPLNNNFLALNVNRAEAEKPRAMVMIRDLEPPWEIPKSPVLGCHTVLLASP